MTPPLEVAFSRRTQAQSESVVGPGIDIEVCVALLG